MIIRNSAWFQMHFIDILLYLVDNHIIFLGILIIVIIIVYIFIVIAARSIVCASA